MDNFMAEKRKSVQIEKLDKVTNSLLIDFFASVLAGKHRILPLYRSGAGI